MAPVLAFAISLKNLDAQKRGSSLGMAVFKKYSCLYVFMLCVLLVPLSGQLTCLHKLEGLGPLLFLHWTFSQLSS